ncbi:uncharacterized protein SCHCODRAFT_01092274 [Schizophyllum commune H4-8]|nr:uncharacterized protein SCHCODRAFT_01092274 [Schizophyllum commune H4-8]KAI5896325.1 hypothetical protein SCHCODRAFT_01092274 [Schizophyllum commune H4-8]
MATETLTQEEESLAPQAPRTSDTITQRGHRGPVPLPSATPFPGETAVNSGARTPSRASPPRVAGSFPSKSYDPERRPRPLGPQSTYPSVQFSRAEGMSTPARNPAAAAPPAGDTVTQSERTRAELAEEAWRVLRALGATHNERVDADPTPFYFELVGWLRAAATSFLRGHVPSSYLPFFNNTRLVRRLNEVLHATTGTRDPMNLREYDLSEVVARAEQSHRTPVQVISEAGVTILITNQEPIRIGDETMSPPSTPRA